MVFRISEQKIFKIFLTPRKFQLVLTMNTKSFFPNALIFYDMIENWQNTFENFSFFWVLFSQNLIQKQLKRSMEYIGVSLIFICKPLVSWLSHKDVG